MEGRWFIQCTLPIKLRQPPCDCKIAEVTFNSIIILKYIQEKKTKKNYIWLQERMETNKYQLYAKSTEIENGFRDILGCGYGNGV